MSFLEMTKLYLAKQEQENTEPIIRILDAHPVKRVVWETENAVIFEDSDGHFWRFLHGYRQCWPVIVSSRKE